MGKQIVFLIDRARKSLACDMIRQAPEDYVCEIRKRTRSLDQNAKMWAMLGEISCQVDWYGRKLTSEDWKDVFTAALKKMDVVPGIDGGFVALGQSTSSMTISEMSDVIELMYAFGAKNNVKFNDFYE